MIPSTWRDVTDDVFDRPRHGLVVGDPTVPDDTGRKRCEKCGSSKPATTGFFHRDEESEDGFAGICNACAYRPIRAEANKHRNSSYLLDHMATERGYESQADMIRDLAKAHGTVRSLAMFLDIGTMTAYRTLRRCGARLKGDRMVSWPEGNTKLSSPISRFARDEGWESEYEMLQVLAKAHKYPPAISFVVGVSSVAIRRKLQDWGIPFEDGRGRWHRKAKVKQGGSDGEDRVVGS